MTYIFVPPGGGVWPPAGKPIGSYNTYAEAKRAAATLVRQGVARQDLTILSVTGWRALGDRIAVLLGMYAAVFAGLILALDLAADAQVGPAGWGVVIASLAGLAMILVAIAGYLRRRTRRFLSSFDPPTSGRHVLLCATDSTRRPDDHGSGV